MVIFYRNVWWVRARLYAGRWLFNEFIQECTMSEYTSVCRSLYMRSWWVATGVNDECIIIVCRCVWMSFIELLEAFMLSAYKIVCRSDEYSMRSYRSARFVQTWVYAGVSTGFHDEFPQERTMNAPMRVCRSVYMSSWWASTGVHYECIQDCMHEWWLSDEFMEECVMSAYIRVWKSVYRSFAAFLWRWVNTRVYAGVHTSLHDKCLQAWTMNAYMIVCRSVYRWVHGELLQEFMMSACRIVCRSDDYSMSSYRSAWWVHTRVYGRESTGVLLSFYRSEFMNA